MTLYDQFNDRLNQQNNHFSSYRNDAIALDIEVIRECENLRNDSEWYAQRAEEQLRYINVMKQKD